MSKRIETLDGLLIFHMLPRSLRARVGMEEWNTKLAACLSDIPAWITRDIDPQKFIGSLAVSMAYTAKVELADESEPALVAFKAWFDNREPDDLLEWVIAFTEIPEPIEMAWAEAFTEGIDAGKISIERKPPEYLTDEEREQAIDVKLPSEKLVGNGSSSKPRQQKTKSQAATISQ